jgi:2,4-dichlorophenol 6-monooxygenase
MIDEVNVLIIGGGAAGLTASTLLSSIGVKSLLVSRHPGTSYLPKAHVLFQKTMEIYSDVGAADAIYAEATPLEQWKYVGYYAGSQLHESKPSALLEKLVAEG